MGTVGILAATGVKVGMAVALALAATAAVRYFHQARHGWRPGARHLRILETAALGPQRAIHLVAVCRRTLLIGTTQGQVVMLADVTGECRDLPAEQAACDSGFQALLSRLLPDREVPGNGHAVRLRTAAETLRTTDQPRAAR